ncbi:hypothetical protein ACFWIB_15385 [Streptomyces sp. NPDC127051]|uniref:hypothetical protein n=1 Tax=Streptomyces sp. NPDC127051 TaxID=3347119 RepID=UPI0036655A51
MLTLLLAAGALTFIALAAVVMSLALRHGEEQDRQTRHADPHAAYWGTERPYPARALRARHARPTPSWARTDRHGDHP